MGFKVYNNIGNVQMKTTKKLTTQLLNYQDIKWQRTIQIPRNAGSRFD